MINSTNSTNFGSTLFYKDLARKSSKMVKTTPLEHLTSQQKAVLQARAKKIGPATNIISLSSKTKDSEIMKFHEINAEYLSHNPNEYNAAGAIMKQRKRSGNFMDEKSPLGHKNTLAKETFDTVMNMLNNLAGKIS